MGERDTYEIRCYKNGKFKRLDKLDKEDAGCLLGLAKFLASRLKKYYRAAKKKAADT